MDELKIDIIFVKMKMIKLTDRLELNGRTLRVKDGYLSAIVTNKEASIIWAAFDLERAESLHWKYHQCKEFPRCIVTDGTRDSQNNLLAVAKEPSHLLSYRDYFQGLNKHIDELLDIYDCHLIEMVVDDYSF